MDLDVGGFDRASWRMDTTGIVSKPYPIPIQMEKLIGAQKIGASIRFPRQVVGYKEVWQQIVKDYVEACQDPNIKSIFIDSATQLWTICHTSLLQEKQEVQLSKGIKADSYEFRERLQPMEFPNDRIRSLIYTARSYGKNLIMSHYPKDLYGEKLDENGKKVEYKTGEIDLDGFKHTKALVDLVIYLSFEVRTNPVTKERKSVLIAKITTCGLPGLGTSAVGQEIEPSYQGILNLQEMMKGQVGG
jgi:hypothetical protein